MAEDLGKLIIDINEGGGAGVGPAGTPSSGPAPRRVSFDPREQFQRMASGLESKREAARELASFIRTPTLANVGQVIGPGSNVAGMMGKLLPVMGPLAIGVAAVGSAASLAIAGLRGVRDMMRALGEEIGGVSPQIQMARAYEQMLKFRTAMQVNRESGNIIARQMRMDAQMEAQLMRLRAKIVTEFGPLVTAATRMLIKAVDGMIDAFTKLMNWLGGMSNVLKKVGTFMANYAPLFGVLGPSGMLLAQQLGPLLYKLGVDVEGIKRNTTPSGKFETNDSFIADLKLMGVTI